MAGLDPAIHVFSAAESYKKKFSVLIGVSVG
jgi:hypothetical protein